MDSLVRKALLGDREAQRECTEKGIVLPCPFCGGNKIKTPYVCGDHFIECSSCHSASNIVSSRKQALKLWNTRPAPPIGRCGECKHCVGVGKNQALRCTLNSFGVEFGLGFITSESFCSYFEPREGE